MRKEKKQKKYTVKFIVNSLLLIVNKQSGQSLIEILVGLSIGAILIGGAGFGISFMLKSTTSSDDMQAASGIVRQTLDEVRSYASANWQNIYSLTKGLDTQYFLNASGTTFYTVQGKEGFLSKDVTNGLVGRWGLDEATGTIAYDMSGNGNDGTLINSPTRATSTCSVGYCLNFNGSNNYINVPGKSILNFTSNGTFSISLWVNPDTLISSWRRGIIVQESYLASGYRLGFYNGGQPMFWTTQSGGSLQLNSSQNLTINKWNHIVVTYNNQQANIYKDGVLSGSAIGTYIMGVNAVRIGAVVSEYFSGAIDDVRIYNRALTATEVKNLYESKPFSAYFSVENACRSNDSSSTITDTEPCQGGSIVDPITEEITATAEWNTRGVMDNISLTDYATRWKNDIFHQTDWSGGSGTDGPLTNPTTQYASSTNVDATTNPGSVRILGL